MTPYEKIKEARTQLSLNQADFADAVGVSQNEVSKLEKGGKKFIPNSYISFLSEKGYDLNTLFDDNQPLKKLQQDHNILQEPKARYLQRTDVMQKNQMIPLFNIEAAAGLVELFQHVDEKTPIDFLSIPNLAKCDGAVFVTGDSM